MGRGIVNDNIDAVESTVQSWTKAGHGTSVLIVAY